MALSPEVGAFKDKVVAILGKIADDINRVLGRSNGLSDEDKAALEAVVAAAQSVDDVVPEDVA